MEPRRDERHCGKVFSYLGGELQPCPGRHNSFATRDRSRRPTDLHGKQIPAGTSDTRVPRGWLGTPRAAPDCSSLPPLNRKSRRNEMQRLIEPPYGSGGKTRWQKGKEGAEPFDRRRWQSRAMQKYLEIQGSTSSLKKRKKRERKQSRSSLTSVRPKRVFRLRSLGTTRREARGAAPRGGSGLPLARGSPRFAPGAAAMRRQQQFFRRAAKPPRKATRKSAVPTYPEDRRSHSTSLCWAVGRRGTALSVRPALPGGTKDTPARRG